MLSSYDNGNFSRIIGLVMGTQGRWRGDDGTEAVISDKTTRLFGFHAHDRNGKKSAQSGTHDIRIEKIGLLVGRNHSANAGRITGAEERSQIARFFDIFHYHEKGFFFKTRRFYGKGFAHNKHV